jgi:hypothetical protein
MAADMLSASIHAIDMLLASVTHKSEKFKKVLHIIPATLMMKINKNKIPDMVSNILDKISKIFFISLAS